MSGARSDTGTTQCCTLPSGARSATDQETIPAGAPIVVDGVRQWVSYREPDIDEDDFDEAGAAFERQDTTTRTGLVGQARCTLLCVRPLVDFAIPVLRRHRNDAD